VVEQILGGSYPLGSKLFNLAQGLLPLALLLNYLAQIKATAQGNIPI
jgi:hypothetical protein